MIAKGTACEILEPFVRALHGLDYYSAVTSNTPDDCSVETIIAITKNDGSWHGKCLTHYLKPRVPDEECMPYQKMLHFMDLEELPTRPATMEDWKRQAIEFIYKIKAYKP